MPKQISSSSISTSSNGLKAFILLLGCLLLMSTAHAQNARTWSGSDNNNWRNNSNWQNGGTPGPNQIAVMAFGAGRNRVDLSNSNGNDVDRSVYAIRFRTDGNQTTVEDYFGPNLDLDANWYLDRGRLIIPESTDPTLTAEQMINWVDVRPNQNSVTLVADIELPSGFFRLSAEGREGFAGNCPNNVVCTDAVEVLNLYGNLSGNARARINTRFDNPTPYRSRLTLHEANDFAGIIEVSSRGELFLRDDSALVNASVQVDDGGVLDFNSTNPILDDLINDSEITVAGRTLTFGTREARTNSGTFVGGGRIRFVGNHPWTSNVDENGFIGRVDAAGTAPFIAGRTNAWANARIDIQTDNGFAFTPNEARIGGLSGAGDLTLDANKVLRLVSDRFDLTYLGDLLGSGQLIQQNNRDWTFDGTSEGSIQVQSGTLSGNGTMADVTINPNGRISPGTSGAAGDIGSQQFSDLTVQGAMDVDIDGPELDQFRVDGQLVLDGASLNVRFATFQSLPAFIFATYDERMGEFDTVTGLPPALDLRYEWDDGTGNTNNLALVRNVAPDANDDAYSTLEDTPLTGQNVLGNDIDGDLDTLMVRSAGTFPADGIGGTVLLESNGDFTYTPPPDLFGSASFTYEVEDNNGATDTALVTITVTSVNDVPSFSIAGDVTANEDDPFTKTTVALDISAGPPDEQDQFLFFLLENSDPSLFQVQPVVLASTGELSFTPAADAFGTAEIELTLLDDGGNEDDDSGVLLSAPQTFSITINPVNDAPTFTAMDPPSIGENAGPQIVNGWASFDSGPVNERDQVVEEYLVDNINNLRLFEVAPAVDAAGNLTYTPADNTFGNATFEVRVRDSGGTDNGGVDTSTAQSFTIIINRPNVAPTFTASNPPPVDEDVGAQTVNNWAVFDSGSQAEDEQSVLAYTVSNVSNADLFAAEPTVDLNGNLSYTPADDAFGVSMFDVTVQDDGGTANGGQDTSSLQTFTITINAVNDGPSFVATDPPPVNEDADPVSLTGWAVFDPGAANEDSQSVLVYDIGKIGNASLFDEPPSVDANGTLTYEVAAGVSGTSTFEIAVQDNGGTANGGQDTSVSQAFTITVLSVNDAPTFTAVDPPQLLEDDGPVSLNNWASFDAGAPDEGSQSVLAYAVSNVSNADLFSTQPAVSNDGTLSFTLAPDANGTTTFDIAVQDDGGTANGGDDTSDTRVFTITVLPVNDPPTFIHPNFLGVNANEDGDFLWAQNLRPGPADESDQIVMFDITNVSNPSMFDQQPMIDSAGQLTFTFDVQDQGRVSSEVAVVAFDDGGTDNGGDPTADPITFVIEAFPVADLTIDKTSDSFFVDPGVDPGGAVITYTIVVTNNGPSEVIDAVVIDNPPPRLGNLSWTCTSQGDALCDNPSGIGPINERVSFLSNASVTYTLQATLQDTSNEPITNTASVATPNDVAELAPGDNTDSDTDAVGLFVDSFESAEPD